MAKRRNAKKEKAARNKINARKFRKKTSRYSSRFKKFSSNNETEQKPSETEESNKTTL
ncbi:MAG: hypothetical protein ACFB4I_23765 [Cyanophyceae cyanobacterium]